MNDSGSGSSPGPRIIARGLVRADRSDRGGDHRRKSRRPAASTSNGLPEPAAIIRLVGAVLAEQNDRIQASGTSIGTVSGGLPTLGRDR